MPFVFDVLKVLLSKTCQIHSPDLLFIWRYCTFVPLFFCWWFILKKHDLTLTVTLTLRRMQKCNSAIVLLSNFISADIIFHKFLPTSFNISLSKKNKYIYIYIFVLNFSFFYLWPKSAKCDESFLLRRCSRPEWDHPIRTELLKLAFSMNLAKTIWYKDLSIHYSLISVKVKSR